ncbi:MAG: hypothetical protein JWO42_25 [Chloroflexi bacterium]|jgi:uncharacterized membrane protein YbhN (UPF0104 family)|nr:hypothetical protein [Chloroflexota bacterium]
MVMALVRRATLMCLGVIAGVLVIRSGFVQTQALQVLDAFGRLRPEAVLIVLGLSTVSMLMSGVIWWRLLIKMGYNVPVGAGLGAYASAGLAGYIVNTAGSAVGCAVSLRRHGVCPARAVVVTLIANALGMCGNLAWAPVGLLLISRGGMNTALPLLGQHDMVVAVAVVVALCIGMLVSLKMLTATPEVGSNLIRRLLKRRPQLATTGDVAAGHSLRNRHALALIPWSAASWFAGTLALYALLIAFGTGSAPNLTDVVGATVLATIFGSLAFFVPSGVGVRDGALIALLAHTTGMPVASCTAAAITVRALDPLTKLALLLVVASGLERLLIKQYLRGTAVLAMLFADGPLAHSLARLSTRLSTPLLEVVAVESE